MIVQLKRTGGFAGIDEMLGRVDTAQLEHGKRKEIEELVERLNFFEMNPMPPDSPIGADFYRYEITIQDGKRDHTVFVMADDPEALEKSPLNTLVKAVLAME